MSIVLQSLPNRPHYLPPKSILLIAIIASIIFALLTCYYPIDFWLHLVDTEYYQSGNPLYGAFSPLIMPLEIVVYYPPVWLLRQIPTLHILPVMLFYFLALMHVSAWLCWKITSNIPGFCLGRQQIIIVSCLYAVWCLLPNTIDISITGRREHLATIFIAPYLFCAIAILRGVKLSRALSVSAGLLGATGFCIRPVFIPIFVASELFLLINNRKLFVWLRTESLIIGLFGAVYISIVAKIYAFTRENTINTVTIINGLGGGMTNIYAAFFLGFLAVIFYTGASLAMRDMMQDENEKKINFYGLTLFFASTLAVILTLRGFQHHIYIANFFLCIYLIALWGRNKSASVIFLLYVAAAFFFRPDFKQKEITRIFVNEAVNAFSPYLAGRKVALLSVDTAPICTILYLSGGHFTGPYRNLPYLLLPYKNTPHCCVPFSALSEAERYFNDKELNFFKTEKPEWVLSSNEFGSNKRIDIIAHLRQDAGFNALWQQYTAIGTVSDRSELNHWIVLYHRNPTLSESKDKSIAIH